MKINLVPNSIFEKAILVDSGALYALADKRDQYHQEARKVFAHIQKERFPVYVTNAVIIESYRLVLNKLGRNNAHVFLKTILGDLESGVLKLERMLSDDEDKAQSLVLKHKAHDITLTDGINFCVMNRMGIFKMFGFDSDCTLVGLECVEAN